MTPEYEQFLRTLGVELKEDLFKQMQGQAISHSNLLFEINQKLKELQNVKDSQNIEDEKVAELKKTAEDIAKELVEHAKETARQMLLTTNLDVSKIPLICNKIVSIQNDLSWIKWLVIGMIGGIGGLFVFILSKKL